MERFDLDMPQTDDKIIGYKIKHVVSGLYYRPNGGYRGIIEKKPNLSKKGKVYSARPDISKGIDLIDIDGVRKYIRACYWLIVEIRGK